MPYLSGELGSAMFADVVRRVCGCLSLSTGVPAFSHLQTMSKRCVVVVLGGHHITGAEDPRPSSVVVTWYG